MIPVWALLFYSCASLIAGLLLGYGVSEWKRNQAR